MDHYVVLELVGGSCSKAHYCATEEMADKTLAAVVAEFGIDITAADAELGMAELEDDHVVQKVVLT